MDASQMTCPKCGWARDPGAADCPACGIVYARYGAQRRASLDETGGGFAPPPPPALDAVNPYAPPRSDVQSVVEAPVGQMYAAAAGGVWRTGDLLVMQRGASLPNRCLLCNRPTAVHWSKKLYWHHPGLYFLILLNLLIYALVALAVRKKADMVLPLCSEHAESRKKASTVSIWLMLGGFLVMIAGVLLIEGDGTVFALMALLGFAALLVGAIVSSVKANIIVAKKIDDYYVWLKKVGDPYLATLPPAPPGM